MTDLQYRMSEITDEMLDAAREAFDDVYDGENWRNAMRAAITAVAQDIAAVERERAGNIAFDAVFELAGAVKARAVQAAIRARKG